MTGRIAVLPQVGHGVRLVVRGAGAVLGEIGWWLAGAWRLIAWAPRRMAAWLTGGVFAVWAETLVTADRTRRTGAAPRSVGSAVAGVVPAAGRAPVMAAPHPTQRQEVLGGADGGLRTVPPDGRPHRGDGHACSCPAPVPLGGPRRAGHGAAADGRPDRRGHRHRRRTDSGSRSAPGRSA